jgi:hypothetical protein
MPTQSPTTEAKRPDTKRRLWGGRDYPRECLQVDGWTWEIETNGHALYARLAAGSLLQSIPEGKRRHVMIDYLTQPVPANAFHVDAVTFSYLGPPEYGSEGACPLCAGEGCGTPGECDDCDGDGTVLWCPEMRPCYVLDTPFNANLIVTALDLVAAKGDCAAWLHPKGAALIVRGTGWLVGVMPVVGWVGEDKEKALRMNCTRSA